VQNEETIRQLPLPIGWLMLSGGEDMDPAFCGEENRYAQAAIHPGRDRCEPSLLRRAAADNSR
jgi:gamma-glutamyl-gamma-aminobutyrate hydrolase PuuD